MIDSTYVVCVLLLLFPSLSELGCVFCVSQFANVSRKYSHSNFLALTNWRTMRQHRRLSVYSAIESILTLSTTVWFNSSDIHTLTAGTAAARTLNRLIYVWKWNVLCIVVLCLFSFTVNCVCTMMKMKPHKFSHLSSIFSKVNFNDCI